MKHIRSLVAKPWNYVKRLSLKKKLLFIAGIIIAIIIISQIINANKPVEYNKDMVKRGTITEVVTEPGIIANAGTVDVTSPATGILEELYVSNDQYVKEGQELFKVKSSASDSDKAAAYAAYQKAVSAQKTSEQTKLSLDAQMWAARQAYLTAQNTDQYKNDNKKNPSTDKDYTDLEKESISSGVVQSEKSFKALEKQVTEADVAISAAQAQVAASSLDYQNTQNAVVKANTSGKVANLSVARGDFVSGASAATSSLTAGKTTSLGSAGQTSSPVLSLINDATVTVKVSIGQSDIAKVAAGQEVAINPDAYTDKIYHGTVARTDSIGQNVQDVVTYYVYLTVTDADERLKAGMTVDTDIITNNRTNVLTVANSAIKPYQGKKAVRIFNAKTKEFIYVPVETGIRGMQRTEIRKGLTEGQEIVTSLTNEQGKRSGLFGQ